MSLYHLKHTQRAARTRTLIQLGGLLVKSGLVEKLGIELGTDLQQNSYHKTKAYALLGLLTQNLSLPENLEGLETLEQLGKRTLSSDQNDEKDKVISKKRLCKILKLLKNET